MSPSWRWTLVATITGLLLGAMAVARLTLATGPGPDDDDPLAELSPANHGSFEGGRSGTSLDAFLENVVQEAEQLTERRFDVPTGGRPSPLFGAAPFTQRLLLFEEFGTDPVPAAPVPGAVCPPPRDARSGPDGAAVDAFLAAPLAKLPARLADTEGRNAWLPQVEAFLGRLVPTAPCEGRPPGEGWAHQRWDEFPARVYFQSVQMGARVNRGARDAKQRHRFAVGEWGPGGLYRGAGTAAGTLPRFHRRMPVQRPDAVWTFDGTFPPKLLLARYGEGIVFRHYNGLPIDPSANRGFGLHTITTHHHNGHNPAESDGFTNAFIFPGQYYDYRWPMQLAGYDTVNPDASDPRAGTPDGSGGIAKLRGDWRETMSTHWFHDHMLDFTAQNVYKGNAAVFNLYSAVDRGNEAIDDGVNLRLPSGSALDWGNRDYDVNLMIADKAWARDGQLWFNVFNTDGFLGDQVLVNWVWKPFLEVRARRYRFRILNGAVSRYFKIALVDQRGNPVPFHMVANDGNIMEHAVAFDGTRGTQAGALPTIGIAERYDIVVDFSRFREADRLYFVNVLEHRDGRGPEGAIPLPDILGGRYRARTRDRDGDGIADEWVDGDPCVGAFMELRVRAYGGVDRSMDPREYEPGGKTMIPLPRPSDAELATAIHRTFTFGRSAGTDEQPWTIRTDGGDGFNMDPRRISAAPNLGPIEPGSLGHLEIWKIRNGGETDAGSGWAHPVHIHFEEGIILNRDGAPPPEWEKWARKDVYRVGEGPDSSEDLEIAIRFREFAGSYMEHCHNTQHEDRAMLLRWDIERPGQLALLPTPIPAWDGVEYVPSVALPTFRTGDGVGPEPAPPPPPPSGVIAAPTGLAVDELRADRVELEWIDQSADEAGFEVERRTGVDGPWARIGTTDANETDFRDETVQPGTLFFYRVRAFNGPVFSPYSNEVSVAVPGAPADPPPPPGGLAAPTGLAVADLRPDRVRLEWTDRSADELGFQVQRKTGLDGAYAQVGSTGANVTTLEDGTVVPGALYVYRVRAARGLTFSTFSNEVTVSVPTTDGPPPPPPPTVFGAPTELRVTLGAGGVDLAWTDASSTELGFQVQRRTGASGAWVQVGSTGANATALRDGTAARGATYFYRVRATRGLAFSDWSNEASVSVP